jgi:hypothetical protein
MRAQVEVTPVCGTAAADLAASKCRHHFFSMPVYMPALHALQLRMHLCVFVLAVYAVQRQGSIEC